MASDTKTLTKVEALRILQEELGGMYGVGKLRKPKTDPHLIINLFRAGGDRDDTCVRIDIQILGEAQ